MPIYLWKCKKCSAEVEVLRNINDHDAIPSGEESGDQTKAMCQHEWKKQIGKTSFKLQGYGWARDNYEG